MKKSNKGIIAGILGVATLGTAGVASAHFGSAENREAIREALDTKSYSAFQEAASESKIVEQIDNEEKFNKLIESKELRDAGDTEGAKAIRDELGLKGKGGRGGKNPAVREAVEANDYGAFVEAAADSRIAETIDSKEKFTQLVEVHTLREAGDEEGAKALKDELGLGGHHKGGHDDRGEKK